MAQRHDRSVAQERRIAEKTGGQRTTRSGAGWLRKGDARNDRFFFEMKRTDNKRSITLKADDLELARRQAIQTDRMMAFGFELNGRHYIVQQDDDWWEAVGEE